MDFLKILGVVLTLTYAGYCMLKLFDREIKSDFLPFGLLTGYVLVSLLIFFATFFRVPYLIVNLIIVLFTIYSLVKFGLPKIKITRDMMLPTVLILLGVFVMTCRVVFEGFDSLGNLRLYYENAHDVFSHMAIQQVLKVGIPPQNPFFYGANLVGYHYLTDLFFNWLNYTTGISNLSLYLNWTPVIFGLVFVYSTLFMVRKIVKDKVKAYLCYILIVLCSGFDYLAPVFFPHAKSTQSVFWLAHPPYYLINQQLTISLAVMNFLYVLLLYQTRKWWAIIGILVGALVGIKVYGFILILPPLVALAIYNLIKFKDKLLSFSLVLSGILSLVIVLIVGSGKGKPFYFGPGLLVHSMYISDWRLNDPTWDLYLDAFQKTHNLKRLIALWGSGFIIFLIGNFGLKVLSLGLIPQLIKQIAVFKERGKVVFTLIVVTLLAITFSMLLLQRGVAWNVVQFLHFAEAPLGVLFVLALGLMKNRKLSTFILVVAILVSLPTTFNALQLSFSADKYYLYPKGFIDDLKKIGQIKTDKFYVGSQFYNSSIVPAITGRNAYLTDLIVADSFTFDYATRKEEIDQLEKDGGVSCVGGQYYVIGSDIPLKINEYIINDKYVKVFRCLPKK